MNVGMQNQALNQDWCTPEFRQTCIQKMQTVLHSMPGGQPMSAADLEAKIFERSKSREDYVNFVKKFISKVPTSGVNQQMQQNQNPMLNQGMFPGQQAPQQQMFQNEMQQHQPPSGMNMQNMLQQQQQQQQQQMQQQQGGMMQSGGQQGFSMPPQYQQQQQQQAPNQFANPQAQMQGQPGGISYTPQQQQQIQASIQQRQLQQQQQRHNPDANPINAIQAMTQQQQNQMVQQQQQQQQQQQHAIPPGIQDRMNSMLRPNMQQLQQQQFLQGQQMTRGQITPEMRQQLLQQQMQQKLQEQRQQQILSMRQQQQQQQASHPAGEQFQQQGGYQQTSIRHPSGGLLLQQQQQQQPGAPGQMNPQLHMQQKMAPGPPGQQPQQMYQNMPDSFQMQQGIRMASMPGQMAMPPGHMRTTGPPSNPSMNTPSPIGSQGLPEPIVNPVPGDPQYIKEMADLERYRDYVQRLVTKFQDEPTRQVQISKLLALQSVIFDKDKPPSYEAIVTFRNIVHGFLKAEHHQKQTAADANVATPSGDSPNPLLVRTPASVTSIPSSLASLSHMPASESLIKVDRPSLKPLAEALSRTLISLDEEKFAHVCKTLTARNHSFDDSSMLLPKLTVEPEVVRETQPEDETKIPHQLQMEIGYLLRDFDIVLDKDMHPDRKINSGPIYLCCGGKAREEWPEVPPVGVVVPRDYPATLIDFGEMDVSSYVRDEKRRQVLEKLRGRLEMHGGDGHNLMALLGAYRQSVLAVYSAV